MHVPFPSIEVQVENIFKECISAFQRGMYNILESNKKLITIPGVLSKTHANVKTAVDGSSYNSPMTK